MQIFCGLLGAIGIAGIFAMLSKVGEPVRELTEREAFNRKKEYYEKYKGIDTKKYFNLSIVLMVLFILTMIFIEPFSQNMPEIERIVLQLVPLLLVFSLIICVFRVLCIPQFPEGYGEELANEEKELIAKEAKESESGHTTRKE